MKNNIYSFIHSFTHSFIHFIQEVDLQLKQACELFILHATAALIHPLKTLLGKFDVVIDLAGKEKREVTNFISRQPFADPSK